MYYQQKVSKTKSCCSGRRRRLNSKDSCLQLRIFKSGLKSSSLPMPSVLHFSHPSPVKRGPLASVFGSSCPRQFAPRGTSNCALVKRQTGLSRPRTSAATVSVRASDATSPFRELAEILQQSGSIPPQKAVPAASGAKIITTEDIAAGQVHHAYLPSETPSGSVLILK